ncbi:MAG: glycosyltransferase family 2 protein [Hymenobacteraceae bacterium]|nr:glycosyltransferase family 2 protein [Hymenobacteraceae bacterium]
MKVVGVTFIRNAICYDYPVVESLRALLPLCDEVIVAVGASDDETRALIAGIDPSKIRILDTVWDDSLREGGQVLAIETDKALAAVPADADWVFYLQGDEVLHEADYPAIRAALHRWLPDGRVDGLLFDYRHFYGSYDYLGAARRWYRHEIRVVRAGCGIYSYRDAQGFRKPGNQKLTVRAVDAHIYHYGWVKDPSAMQGKQETFNRYWHDDAWTAANVAKAVEFDYSGIDALTRFPGTHPAVMAERIRRRNWSFDHDLTHNRIPVKDRLKALAERWFGLRLGYKNYRLLR